MPHTMPPTPTQTPPAGLYPFWFWNDDLDADEIRRQIYEMHAKGVKGFFIHPRQGLQQPYMSSSFLGLVRVAIETARRLGMVVHLYDEYPYPSGVAGGEVILGRPAFQATHLQQRIFDVKGGRIRLELTRGYTLQCIAFPITDDGVVEWLDPQDLRADVGMVLRAESFMKGGLTVYNRKRYFASEPTPTLDTQLPPGQWRIFLSTQTLVEGHKYWYNFVDVLNPEAIREFLRLTHERYFRCFGEDFGGLVQSIFVDETAPQWSALIPAEFAKECGYDLSERLCALQDESHPQHLRTTADLQRVRHRMFCESFDGQIRDWCHAHGLKYSGEKTQQRFSQFDYMDIPGCEPGHTKAGNPDLDYLRAGLRQNARAATSAAYFHGKEGALCECFHSLGWSGTLQDARLIAEGLLLMGIRYLVPHGFFYSTHGLKKHDAPPTFFHQMPYWPLFGHMTARLDRITIPFEGTWIDAKILLLDPSAALPTEDQSAVYERLLWNLAGAHLDFHIGDLDVLSSAQMEGSLLRVRDLEIST
ncbi:MAG: hypothetical protein KAI66_01710, partial [Lentisphaeria bacterium]|nr:hypothetical protein [Lentisphaeria bacterium]